MQAEQLGLNWREAYLAILRDLGARNIKLHTQWDFVEGRKGEYYFADIDWQVRQAERYGAKLIYVAGMKTGRWPECHLPDWGEEISQEEQQEALLEYVSNIVARYKASTAVAAWQAENEPLFKFGECPWYDEEFLKKEVALIKAIDPSRPVVISDSGEQSWWLKAGSIADVVGTTMYRKVWVYLAEGYGFYLDIPISPATYWLRAKMVHQFFGKRVINVELQAEPWAGRLLYDVPLEEQEKTMNLQKFKKNISYAKRSGLDEFYLWGTEWWFWLKEKHGKPEIWNEAKKLF